MASNLPSSTIEDSAAGTKLYFERYGETALEFPANDVTTAVSFFRKAGFDIDAANTSAMILLRQAKIDGTPIGQILGVFRDYSSLQLNQIVAEILNNNRVSTSLLGFRTQDVKPNQLRNIAV